MELRHLRVFLVLSEELHFGRTAARLHVAQSAISQTLRDLESELEARLLERTSRQVKLTEAGQAFQSYAREAVQVVDRGVTAARVAQRQGDRLKLRLLMAARVAKLPSLLRRFQAENPETALEVRDGTSARNLETIEGGFCEVALVSLASAKRLGSAYGSLTLESSTLGVVVPASHRLAKKEFVQITELRGERILSLQRDEEPDVRQRLDARLAGVGAVPTAIELSHPQALLPLIAAGLGVSILPAFVARETPHRLRVVPLAGAPRGGVIAVWNKQRISDPTRRFLELLTACYAPPASRPPAAP